MKTNSPNRFRDLDIDGEVGVLPSPNAADSVNPYAAPLASSKPPQPDPIGLWKDGDLLVIHRESVFPAICLATNKPTNNQRVMRLYWTKLFSICNRTLKIRIGISSSRCNYAAGKKWLGALLFAFPLFVPFGILSDDLHILMFICCWFTATVFSSAQFIKLKVRRVQEPYFWIKGVNQDFVRQLPDFPFK